MADEREALKSALPQGVVITDPDGMAGYRWDRALHAGAGVPLAVVRASSTEDVQTAVRFAAARGIPVIPRGAGSGLSGGSAAVDGCIVVSLERMTDVEIDPVNRVAVAQPGAMNADVKTAAAAHALWYPPDPSSFEFCSIGGNVATNAGGFCCVKYGVTTDYVLGMTVVLADGTAVTLGGPRLKDVAGLSMSKLFVGSEGTLGIITEVVLRLIPEQRPASTVVAFFETLDGATQAVVDITGAMRPSMLEFMDNATINAVEDMIRMGLDRSAAGMLIVRSDEPAEHARREVDMLTEICERNGAADVFSTDDPDEGEAFSAARRMALPAVEKLGTVLLEDVGVPISKLGTLVSRIADIAKDRDIVIAVVAHAGDGNTHPVIVFDPSDESQKERAEAAFNDVIQLTLSLGGTITGEHGVGRIKQPWLGQYLGDDAMALNRRIKTALDPHNILNPGAKL